MCVSLGIIVVFAVGFLFSVWFFFSRSVFNRNKYIQPHRVSSGKHFIWLQMSVWLRFPFSLLSQFFVAFRRHFDKCYHHGTKATFCFVRPPHIYSVSLGLFHFFGIFLACTNTSKLIQLASEKNVGIKSKSSPAGQQDRKFIRLCRLKNTADSNHFGKPVSRFIFLIWQKISTEKFFLTHFSAEFRVNFTQQLEFETTTDCIKIA